MSIHEGCPCMETCPLNRGPTRYNALKRTLDGVSNTMLAAALRELEAAGLVARREYLEVPVRVEYAVAPAAQALIPILDALGRWSETVPAEGGGPP